MLDNQNVSEGPSKNHLYRVLCSLQNKSRNMLCILTPFRLKIISSVKNAWGSWLRFFWETQERQIKFLLCFKATSSGCPWPCTPSRYVFILSRGFCFLVISFLLLKKKKCGEFLEFLFYNLTSNLRLRVYTCCHLSIRVTLSSYWMTLNLFNPSM